jgi:hypothetical protein
MRRCRTHPARPGEDLIVPGARLRRADEMVQVHERRNILCKGFSIDADDVPCLGLWVEGILAYRR